MFTFLDHDGVPWNNTNAEHAIKRFAKYRRDADGLFTEHSLEEYLVLASVFETCEFNNVNVLKFLLSKEEGLQGLLRMAGRGSNVNLDRTQVGLVTGAGLGCVPVPARSKALQVFPLVFVDAGLAQDRAYDRKRHIPRM